MKTSVACCVYNGARHLGAQLDSLVAQSRRPDEIVVVDDHSTDASASLIDAFARSLPSDVTLIVERNAHNLGIVANFEKALASTTGDVIFLCDQDDVWHPSKIETMTRAFEQRADLLMLFTDARLIDDRGRPLGHTLFESLEMSRRERRSIRSGDAFSALIARNLVTGAGTALRRSVFERARPFPIEWVHDEWLAIHAAALGTVDFVESPLFDYRQHASNQIGVRRLTLRDKVAKLFAPRGDRYRKMERRTDLLLQRLSVPALQVAQARLDRIADKLAHVRVRSCLPLRRVARPAAILRETASRRYGRYSLGLRGILRDCFER